MLENWLIADFFDSSYSCSESRSYCISSDPTPSTIFSTYTYTTYNSASSTETDIYTYTWATEFYTAFAIQVRWQASDLPNLQTDPLTPGATPPTILSSSITPTSTATPTPTATSNSTSSELPQHGLSTGAKAGIGVGVAVGALAFFAGIALWIFRRRQKKRREAGHGDAVSRDSMASPVARTNYAGTQTALGYSSAPLLAAEQLDHSSLDLETQRLREEQAKLQERKDRLLQIEQIEEEQELLRQRLAYTQGHKSPQSLSTQISDPQELNA
jgi:hypothetical protein